MGNGLVTEVSYKGSRRRNLPRRASLKRVSIRGTGGKKKAVAGRVAVSSKKPNVVQILRDYGLPASIRGKQHLRYRQPLERGILWYWFSLYIRLRDKDLPCISCGEYKEHQAGHFIPTGSCSWDGLVFSELNVSGECANCNNRDKRKLKYGINLNERHQYDAKGELEEAYAEYRASGGKNWKRTEYIEKINHYQQAVDKLSGGKSGVLESE